MKSRFPIKILALFVPFAILIGMAYVLTANYIQEGHEHAIRDWSKKYESIEENFLETKRLFHNYLNESRRNIVSGVVPSDKLYNELILSLKGLYKAIEVAAKDKNIIKPKQYQEIIKKVNEYDNTITEINDQLAVYNDKIDGVPRKFKSAKESYTKIINELNYKSVRREFDQFYKKAILYINEKSGDNLSQLRYAIESIDNRINKIKNETRREILRNGFSRTQRHLFNYIETSNQLGFEAPNTGLITRAKYEEKQIHDNIHILKKQSLTLITKTYKKSLNIFHALSFIFFFTLILLALYKIILEEKMIHEFEDAIYKKTTDNNFNINDYSLPIKYKSALTLLNKGNVGDFDGLWQAITHLSNEYLFIVDKNADIITYSDNIGHFIEDSNADGLPSILNLINREEWLKIAKTKLDDSEMGSISHTVLIDSKKRELHVSIKYCQIHVNNKMHFLIIADDLTNQIIADERLKNVSNEARKLNKSKNTFIANMGHELRTPLNSIISYAQLIKKSASMDEISNEDVERDGNKIINSGIKLLNMINDILDFAKLESGKEMVERYEFDLDELLTEIKKTFEKEPSERGNKMAFQNNLNLSRINTDRQKLKKSIFAFIRHAIYTTENGIISTSLDLKDDQLIIKVKDTGDGIGPEELKNIFTPFDELSSKEEYRKLGTSLGLAITKRYADLLSGRIEITSEPSNGTTIIMSIPLHKSATKSFPKLVEAPMVDSTFEQRSPVVLVIDDDPKSLEIISRYLRDQNIQVVTATTGKEGLMLAKELRPQIITMDIRLPDIEGWTLIGALKREVRTRDIPVIFISILNEVQKGISLGATDYLVKPIDEDRLLNIVNRYAFQDTRPILVVDDIESNRDILCRSLESLGKSFIEAENGKKAIESLHTITPSLILLDLMMPVMDGFTFLNEIKQNPIWKNIPIIIVTARELSEIEKRRLHENVDKIINKGNLGLEYLVNEIKDFMDQHSTFSK